MADEHFVDPNSDRSPVLDKRGLFNAESQPHEIASSSAVMVSPSLYSSGCGEHDFVQRL